MSFLRPARSGNVLLLFLVATFAFVATTMFGLPIAHAQTISVVNEASLPRLNKNRNTIQKRSLTLTPEAVNLQDCIDDQLIRFTLQMAGFEVNASVQAWASNSGQDCKVETARGGGVQTCWPLLDREIALQTTIDVDIPVRKIMSGAPPFRSSAPDATENACGKVNLSTISVHFLYFAAGNTSTATQAKTIAVTVDTVGPSPPSGLTALPGNTRVQVSWVNISGGSGDGGATGGLTELTGVKVYCDPAGSAPASSTPTTTEPACHDEEVDAGDASTTTIEVCDDAGTSSTTGTTAATSGCTSANFVKSDGTRIFPTADFNAKYECGSIAGNTGTTVVASSVGGAPLANGTTYAVAVAATDKYGNVGQLSDVVCQTPNITTDFWDDYKKAGGAAGGGCSTSDASSVPFGSLALLVLVVASAVSAIQRKVRYVRSRKGEHR
jgi:hypothetical protein